MVEPVNQFFGYGSLVNLKTHSYHKTWPAKIHGWRRCWVYSNKRDASYLSVCKSLTTSIQGIVADVADIGWQVLDQREAAYQRRALSKSELLDPQLNGVQIYVADPKYVGEKSDSKPILLSYLDCVVQGFLQLYGEEGVQEFFETTEGWDRSIKNDRNDPEYPRACKLSSVEINVVDRFISQLPSVVK